VTIAALRPANRLSDVRPHLDAEFYAELRQALDEDEILELGAALKSPRDGSALSKHSASDRALGQTPLHFPGAKGYRAFKHVLARGDGDPSTQRLSKVLLNSGALSPSLPRPHLRMASCDDARPTAPGVDYCRHDFSCLQAVMRQVWPMSPPSQPGKAQSSTILGSTTTSIKTSNSGIISNCSNL
jgi:hypothetical protein